MQQLERSRNPAETAVLADLGNGEVWGEAELAATLDSVGNGVWVLDLEGRCVFINQAACRIFGYAREECVGRRFQCVVHRGDPDGWVCPKPNCCVQSALASGSAAVVNEDVFRRRDGTSLAVQYFIQPVVVHGRIRGSVISIADITEKKRAQEALRKSDEWLRFAQDAAGVGIFDLDIKTGEVKASQGQFRLSGLDPAGQYPSHEGWRKLIHPEDREHIDRQIELGLSGVQPPGSDYRVVWADGSVHWLFMKPTVFFDETGRATRLVGVNVDITGRVQAETALDQFFSASQTPLLISGLDGRVQRANLSWEPELGFTPAELQGRLMADMVLSEDRAAVEAEIEKLPVSGKRTGFECRARCKDGSYRWLLVNADVPKDAPVIYITAHDITQRKKDEETLRNSEARFRSAFENSLFGITITALNGRFLQVNQSLCRITGFAEQELLQMDFAAITHPDDLRKNLEFKRTLMEGGDSDGISEKRYVRPDGEPVWVRVNVALVRDALGKPLHFIALVEDLTGQKRAEEKARRSEEWLRFTLNEAGIGLCYRELGETRASEQQFRLYGLEPAEDWLSRENWLQAVHPEDRQWVEQRQRLALEQAEPYDIQFRVVWPDGSVHWLLGRGKTFHDDDGVVRKTEVTVDVTERQRAEAALQQFFALSRSPMSILGFDGSVKRANAELLRVSGFTLEEFAQRPVLEFFHPDDRAAMQAEIQNLIARGGSAAFDCRGLCKDGSIVWLNFSATAAPDERLIFTVAYDITERKRMVEALELDAQKLARSNAELERFAYVASHDLQEPLRMVASFTQLLAKRYSGQLDETADRYIHYAVDGAKRMQQLIADLLAYSRVTNKQFDFRLTSFEEVVKGAAENLSVAIGECCAEITWDPLPTLVADPSQLGHLFQNLIGNAIKFRRELPPRVHVSAAENGAEWLFSVRDNGIGIDPSHGERIFEVFRRLHSRAEYPGAGIGLSICKTVVDRHGGRIWIESKPGAGSTFWFTLPNPTRNGGIDEGIQ